MSMTPSDRQQVVYDTWQNTDSNILIQAVAGGAKTTTLIGLLERSEYRTLILAFNKTIQVEFERRIIAGNYTQGKAMTLHSLGLAALRAYYGKIRVESNKNWNLLKSVQSYNKGMFSRMSWEDKVKTGMTLMDMNDVSRIYLTNDKREIFKYMGEMDKFYFESDYLDRLWTEFIDIRAESYTNGLTVDFLDMIYLPVIEEILIPVQPYYLMIDEAQDLSYIQHLFVDRLINQGDIKKWVAVGDVNQAIYGFSGASASSFDLFRQKENVVELPLDVCYRCPQLIIEEANAVYDVMHGFKRELGVVEDINNPYEIKDASMIVCRNTAPLVDLYFLLLGQGKKVYLKGEDFLASLTKFLKPYAYKSVSEAIRILNSEILELKNRENKSDEQRYKYYRLVQNQKNFVLLANNFGRPSDKVEIILQSLNSMFEEIPDETAITLCTIHKSKGLEADIVYILDEYLIPSKFAKSPQQIQQEKNLKYVARTRARKELYYLNLGKEKEEELNLI